MESHEKKRRQEDQSTPAPKRGSLNRIARRWASLESLPLEVWRLILILLPIDEFLLPVAQAARNFSEILLNDWHFAHKHVKFYTTTIRIRDSTAFYSHYLSMREGLPLPYAASMLRSCFTVGFVAMDQLRAVFQSFSVTKHAGERIVAALADLLDTDSLAYMLEWMVTWAHCSNQAVLDVLRNHSELPVPQSVMYAAAELGWIDVTQLLISRGLDIMSKHDGVLAHAIRHGQKDVVVFLLQDKRLDLSSNNHSLCRFSKSLDIAETLFLDGRVKNGEFLLSVARGDVDAVTKYLHLSANSNLAGPKKVFLLIAVHFDQPEVLTVLLQDKRLRAGVEHHQRLLRESAVGQSWKVFRNLIGHPQSDPFQKKWNLYNLLCSGETYEDYKLEAFKAFVSLKEVKMRWVYTRWSAPLELACKIGAINLLEYVLATAGGIADVNCSDVIRGAIMHARTRDGGDRILKILAGHESFRLLDTQYTGHLVHTLCDPTRPLAKYVLKGF
ncbi:hypothetical protein HDU81_009904 [Chytriomyces hyalinus]|nr:hypothetical protein HDU81_009904 [Chytriomyces hyalinus]